MLFDLFRKVPVLSSRCKVLPSRCKVLPSGRENYVTLMCWMQFLLTQTSQARQTKISYSLARIYLFIDVEDI
jgi:hypothetical protein